jgi:hypothetical protein
MSICSRLGAAAVVGGVLSDLVLAGTSAQQAVPPPPARVVGPASTPRGATTRVPVQVQRTAVEGGGWKVETRDVAVDVGWSVTPEIQKLHAEELEAANEAKSLSEKITKAESDSQREELKAALRAALVRQFDAQQKRRTEEIASIEERLSKLKETLQKRNASKDAIVGRRLDQMMGVRDELAWEETLGEPYAGPRHPAANQFWAPGTYTPQYPPSVYPSPVPILPIVPAVPAPPAAAAPPTPPAPAAVPSPVPPAAPRAPGSTGTATGGVSRTGTLVEPGAAPRAPAEPAAPVPAPAPAPAPPPR